MVEASIDGKMVTSQTVKMGKGFVGFGMGGFYPGVFDDFSMTATGDIILVIVHHIS